MSWLQGFERHTHLAIYKPINQFYRCSWIKCHTIYFFTTLLLYKLDTLLLKQLDITDFPLQFILILKMKPAISNRGRFFYFNSTVSFT